MATFPLAMVGSTPYQMLTVLDPDDEKSKEVLSYFQPTCDCLADEHVQQEILDANATTIAAIKEMIKADAYTIPPGPPLMPAATILVSTACTGTSLVGTYLTPAGETVNQVIETASSSC